MDKPKVRAPRGFNDQLKFLIYGRTGVGKTHLVGTAANSPEFFGRVLMLAVDPGDLTLTSNHAIDSSNIDIDRITSIDELEKWCDWLEIENPKTKEYGTVIIEGATDIAELALLEVLQRTWKKDKTRPQYSPDIAHYKEQQIIGMKGVRIFRDLPMHVIYTALEQEKKDSENGINYIRPSVPGQLVNNLGAYFDFIGHLDVGTFTEGKGAPRLLRMQPTDRIQAKDRTRRLGTIITEPTMPMLLDMILNGPELAPAPRVDHVIKRPKFTPK